MIWWIGRRRKHEYESGSYVHTEIYGCAASIVPERTSGMELEEEVRSGCTGRELELWCEARSIAQGRGQQELKDWLWTVPEGVSTKYVWSDTCDGLKIKVANHVSEVLLHSSQTV